MKSIIPAADFGTRLLPLNKVQPKEILPIVNKPTIQWFIEEAVDAGIRDMVIITGKHEPAIETILMPNFAKLIKEGIRATLRSFDPLLTPIYGQQFQPVTHP